VPDFLLLLKIRKDQEKNLERSEILKRSPVRIASKFVKFFSKISEIRKKITSETGNRIPTDLCLSRLV